MFYIGVHLEKEGLKVAILKKEKNSAIAIESLHTLLLGPDHVKQFYNLPPFHTGKETAIASGVESSDTFIRKLHIPLRDRRKVLEALPFQLEALLPFPETGAIICPLFKLLGKQMTAVTIIATTEEALSSHLKALKEIDIAPDAVSCAPVALMRFGKWQLGAKEKMLHFHVRDQKVSCALYEGAEMLLSQFLCEDAALEKLSIFLKQKGAIDDKTPWLLTGDYNYAKEIGNFFLGERLNIENPELGSFAIPIGFALDALQADGVSVQFCQKKFTPAHTAQRRKKNILCYAGICLGAALLMAIGGSLVLSKKQKALAEGLQGYLSKPFDRSVDGIEQALYAWEQSTRGQRNSFPFLPNVPKVSDVLAWLSAHPAFATEEGGQKEGIDIKSLHYSLHKYPKIGDASSPYIAGVELEFTSQAPRAARDFHEALLKGDQIVNAKKEVKWQVQNQTYSTSFELNKGRQP